jgi:hypothetical protein
MQKISSLFSSQKRVVIPATAKLSDVGRETHGGESRRKRQISDFGAGQ